MTDDGNDLGSSIGHFLLTTVILLGLLLFWSWKSIQEGIDMVGPGWKYFGIGIVVCVIIFVIRWLTGDETPE